MLRYLYVSIPGMGGCLFRVCVCVLAVYYFHTTTGNTIGLQIARENIFIKSTRNKPPNNWFRPKGVVFKQCVKKNTGPIHRDTDSREATFRGQVYNVSSYT